jgi:hypothetical protein
MTDTDTNANDKLTPLNKDQKTGYGTTPVNIDKFDMNKSKRNNFTANSKNTANDIFNKLKNRLPMFIINIYCATTTFIYGDDMLKGTIEASDKRLFPIYYIFMCACAIIWDLWHSLEAYIGDKTFICKFCFCSINLLTSFPLFILATNVVSFGLPFYIFFGFTKNDVILIYGAILSFVYMMDLIEKLYWKASVENYTRIEDADDTGDNKDNEIDIYA